MKMSHGLPTTTATPSAAAAAGALITRVLRVASSDISFPPVPAATGHPRLDASPVIASADAKNALQEAARLLVAEDQVVAMPTETVYGLAGNARSTTAVSRIFAAKNRPSDNPLIVHVASLAMLRSFLPNREIPALHAALIDRFWPGPLTLLFPVADNSTLSPLVTAGQPTVGVRLPDHPVARALIATAGVPLAAPSANASGRPSPTLAKHVSEDLDGRIPLIIDGGRCEGGLESTVLQLDPYPLVLRPGGVTLEALRLVPGLENVECHIGVVDPSVAPSAPGMKYRHYSPTAEVHLVISDGARTVDHVLELLDQSPAETRIGWLQTRHYGPVESLPEKIQQAIASARLVVLDSSADPCVHFFSGLRELDEARVSTIVVQGLPEEGLGRAFMNRAKKAASLILT
ncbi:DHBP synthase RibB-like alpha/beta domain-containing protein [Blastocladiella britannica]|nr:DHBP synthase RibB-like alpha/beta domain-containing protein [Blastocladiella britannica]